MKLSISNLAWRDISVSEFAPAIRSADVRAVEIAPTAIWPDAPDVSQNEIRTYAQMLADHGLEVSGIQSLLFGHPEHQLFDQRSWPGMLEHMRSMIHLAGHLGADVAVFGSPRNRTKGVLGQQHAQELAVAFFRQLVGDLDEHQVALTLEPNAPDYGADYLTHYADAVALADAIGSPRIQPQIDTGCLYMVGDDPAAAARYRLPGHVHISAPNLVPPPAGFDHSPLAAELVNQSYRGWVVLEMLPGTPDPLAAAREAARWLATAYASKPA